MYEEIQRPEHGQHATHKLDNKRLNSGNLSMEENLKEVIYQTSNGYTVKLRYPDQKQESDEEIIETTKDIMKELVYRQLEAKGEF